MNYLRILFFVCAVLSSSSFFAQQVFNKKVELNWEDSKEIFVYEDYSINTILVANNYLDEDLNPSYVEKWRVEKDLVLKNFSFNNVIYENIDNPANSVNNPKALPKNLEIDLKFVNARDKKSAVLYFTPIIYDGNIIKKVISFELSYDVSLANNKQANKSSVKNSVLATGEWFKFAVDTTGVFKLDKQFLESIGMNLSGINPQNIKIYGNGGAMLPFKNSDFRYDGLQENSIFVNGEDDGVFDSNDYILFYARGPHKWLNEDNTYTNLRHQFNIFSDVAYYFVTVSSSSGLRINNRDDVSGAVNSEITNFDDYTFYELDEYNLFDMGQQWFFKERFSFSPSQTFNIPFSNIEESQDLLVRVRGVSSSYSKITKMNVHVNNQDLFDLSFGTSSYAIANEGESNVSLSGNSLSVEILYDNNGNYGAEGFLDYIEIIGKRKLIANEKQFSFRNFEVIKNNGIYEFVISNSSNINSLWDVSDPISPKFIENNSANSNFSFLVTGGINHQFIAVNDDDFYSPKKIENPTVDNQNLHIKQNVDYIIVTADFLMAEAERLADYHRTNSNLIVEVIDVNEIYNEFSSGSPDLTAIRDFAKHLYDNSNSNILRYLCLFGDASYDYKNRSGNYNIIPTFETYESFNKTYSFVTDDYYCMMDDNEGLLNVYDLQDIATGRIVVSTTDQARSFVNKILRYQQRESYGDWRSEITLVADDVDKDIEFLLQGTLEEAAENIQQNYPMYNLKKIYSDSYSQEYSALGESYPEVKTDLINQFKNGTLIIDYVGHGGASGLASEGIFRITDIKKLDNENKLPLVITATCEFARFDNHEFDSAGEYLLWNVNGGAQMLISTTRAIGLNAATNFNKEVLHKIVQNVYDLSIAESFMDAKNSLILPSTQRYFVFAFGDPALKLSAPKPNILLTEMNGILIEDSIEPIKALSYNVMKGQITDPSGNLLNNFNGILDVTIFDKPIEKETLGNNTSLIMEFLAIESKIFTGKAKVENGLFSFDFVAPKDIRIVEGNGKLSMYSYSDEDSQIDIDKGGYNIDIVIGGINEDAPEDNIGPTVELFMDELSFINGGTTDSSPLFIAILGDENGINTSITAVGHNIIAVLDGDESNPIILNDYYETELDDYKNGRIDYPFSDLSAGEHTITFKAWDTYNNLSESSLDFIVIDDGGLELKNVLNYPNPFINYTEFWFNHNKPNELLTVQIQIFTVSGKLVKTINEAVQNDGTTPIRSIIWDGLDDFGSKIGKGVYVYKLKVKSVSSGIKAEKTEKLVILQ